MVDPQNLVPHVCNKELVSLFGIAIFQNKASLNQVQNYLWTKLKKKVTLTYPYLSTCNQSQCLIMYIDNTDIP